MDDRETFRQEAAASALRLGKDAELQRLARDVIAQSDRHHWSYQWTWLGVPIIQMPPDIVATQEIIWKTKPQIIIETGVARGGSLILYASILELLGEGKVIGVDVEIRAHNRASIESHPLSKRIELIESDALSPTLHEALKEKTKNVERVMVILDSNHTHEHVLQELKDYGTMASVGSYCVVFDTFVEDMPPKYFPDRPWDKGNSPKTAVHEFVSEDDRFVIDRAIDQKLLITVAPSGYLKRVK